MSDLVNNSHIDNNNEVPAIVDTPVGKALASHFSRYPFNEGLETKEVPLFHNPKAGLTEVGGVGQTKSGHRDQQRCGLVTNGPSRSSEDIASSNFLVTDCMCD